MAAIVTRISPENRVEMRNARRVEMRPCPSMKPTMSGMLARWQGLSRMLRIPHANAAARATAGAPARRGSAQ